MKNVSRIFGLALACSGLAFAASTVKVDLGKEYQVIRGFGGMVHNTWQGGRGLSDADAKLAFSNGDGAIGLNTLRIPVNENSSAFGNELEAAKSAKKYAGNDFILFATPWTSPYASKGSHVSASNYQAYTDHLNSFAEYMKNKGMPLYGISIANEPDYCGEWTCWSNDEVYAYTKNYAGQLRKHGTKVISPESFSYSYTWGNATKKALYDGVLSDAEALKNWDILGAHFYASEASTGDQFFTYQLADDKKVERWMTEHYTESQGSANYWRKVMVTGDQATASKKDTVRAMDIAYDIHRALAVGNFSQYTWWYIRRSYSLIMESNNASLGVPSSEVGKITKRGYIMSQFARFVRPGAIRVDATMKPEANVFASAYKSADGDSTIIVLLNRDYLNSKEITINVSGANIETFHVYTTSEAKNAKYEGEIAVKNGSATIKMESGATNKDCIVTLVGVGPQIVIPQEPFKGAVTLPGKIEMENFDIPGSGKGNDSYYDNDAENHGTSDYRKDTGVDLYAKATGVIVGYIQKGEWLEYTVNIDKAGDYTMYAAVASDGGSSFKLSIDGNDITEDVVVPPNEKKEGEEQNFDDYSKVKANVTLPAGEHVLRMTATGDWFDIDYINFVPGKDAADDTPLDTPIIEECPAMDGAECKPSSTLKFQPTVGPQNYAIFSISGVFVGKVQANDVHELKAKTSAAVGKSGVYLVKSVGKTFRISVTK